MKLKRGRRWNGGHPVTSEERCVLALLANDPNGATEATLVAEGFSISMLARLVVDGFVIALAPPWKKVPAVAGRHSANAARGCVPLASRKSIRQPYHNQVKSRCSGKPHHHIRKINTLWA